MSDKTPRFIELVSPDNKKSFIAIGEIIMVEQNPDGVNTVVTLRSLDKKTDQRSYLRFKEYLHKYHEIID
jgi:hypothetical protein